MKITTFISDKTFSKVPKSPFLDKTFEFKTARVSLEGALELLRNEFVLNRDYDFKSTTRLRRTKKDLAPFLNEKLEFIIVDFDGVKDAYSEKMIIDFFIKHDYYVGIIPSRSHNGKTSFNLKGIIKVNGINSKGSIRAILEQMNEHLFNYAKIDLTSMNEGAFQSPSYSNGITLLRKGKYIPKFMIKDDIKEHLEIEISDSHSDVVDICISEYRMRGFSVSSINEENGIVTFSHHSERTKNGYFIFITSPFFMNHFDKSKSFNIFSSVKHRSSVMKYFDEIKMKERECEFSGTGKMQKCISVNKRYLDVTEKEISLINEWLDTEGLFKIKSPMGTGKSNVIERVLEECDTRGKRVLLITNRVSVADDFSKKYNMKIYSDYDYNVGDNLIVQFDSLRHYSLKNFDVVILDEFVSLTLHSRNNMNEFSNLNKVKLLYAMKTKNCLIADAFLFGFENDIINTKPTFGIVNNFREDTTIKDYSDLENIISKILEVSLCEKKEGRKVSVSCTSKILSKSIQQLLDDIGLKTMLLSGETLDAEKELIYGEFVKETHNSWDVLIYTPALTVGVSIINQIKHHFHIDESMSTDVISSLQMIRRSRKAENIHYFVKERKRFLETSLTQLNQEVKNNIDKHYKNHSSLLIAVDEFGDFVLSPVGEFMNATEILYNKFENDHKHSFKLLLKHQFSSDIESVEKYRHKIDINLVKKSIKERELGIMMDTIKSLEESDYSELNLESFVGRKFFSNDKDKMVKLMSEINSNLKHGTPPETLKEVTDIEIRSNFKFISRLKKLKYFLTKNENDINQLLSYMVSETLHDKGQIRYFKYMKDLKKRGVHLKTKFVNNDIKQIDELIQWGDFREFIAKIGFEKRGNTYILNQKNIDLVKILK